MTYTPQTWVDNNASYPLSAARMNYIEAGIEDASLAAGTAQAGVNTLTDQRGAVFITEQSFTGVSSQIISNCFSADYDLYDIVFTQLQASTNTGVKGQLRAGSTTETSAQYYWQQFYAANTSVVASRSASQTAWTVFALGDNGTDAISVIRIGQPALTRRTTYITLSSYRGATANEMYFSSGDLNTSTAYDSLVLTPGSGTITGNVRIYGWAAS